MTRPSSAAHRRAVRKHYQKQREAGIPRAEDVNRAITHALRNHFAHFVNIGQNRPCGELLRLVTRDAFNILLERGFDRKHVRRMLPRALQPVSLESIDRRLVGDDNEQANEAKP